jgi:hypothetical protein
LERRTPKKGDIVLKREAGHSGNHYTVREFPGVAQVSYRSFEIALDIATRYGRSARVDVWHEEHGHFTLIESRAAADTA